VLGLGLVGLRRIYISSIKPQFNYISLTLNPLANLSPFKIRSSSPTTDSARVLQPLFDQILSNSKIPSSSKCGNGDDLGFRKVLCTVDTVQGEDPAPQSGSHRLWMAVGTDDLKVILELCPQSNADRGFNDKQGTRRERPYRILTDNDLQNFGGSSDNNVTLSSASPLESQALSLLGPLKVEQDISIDRWRDSISRALGIIQERGVAATTLHYFEEDSQICNQQLEALNRCSRALCAEGRDDRNFSLALRINYQCRAVQEIVGTLSLSPAALTSIEPSISLSSYRNHSLIETSLSLWYEGSKSKSEGVGDGSNYPTELHALSSGVKSLPPDSTFKAREGKGILLFENIAVAPLFATDTSIAFQNISIPLSFEWGDIKGCLTLHINPEQETHTTNNSTVPTASKVRSLKLDSDKGDVRGHETVTALLRNLAKSVYEMHR
jgi:hypothetical protein